MIYIKSGTEIPIIEPTINTIPGTMNDIHAPYIGCLKIEYTPVVHNFLVF
jgi:hypothetical protein